MAIGAEVDEGGLEGGFYAGDLAAVDVGLLLLPGTRFDVQVIEALSIDQSDAQLFGLGRIDEHPFHVVSQTGRAGGRPKATTKANLWVLRACSSAHVADAR